MNSTKRMFPAAAGAATKHIRTATTGSLANGEQALNLPFKPEAAKKGARAAAKARRLPPPSSVGMSSGRALNIHNRPESNARGGVNGGKGKRFPPPSKVGL